MLRMLLICLLSISTLIMPGLSFAQENPSQELATLFMRADTKLDGAEAEEYAAQLGQEFRNDKLMFIKVLSSIPPEQQEIISTLVAYNCEYFGLEGIKKDTETLITSGQLTDLEVTTGKLVLAKMDSLIAARNVPPGTDPGNLTLPNFDVETIKNFIEVQKDLGNPIDEEYFQILKKSLKADAKEFVRMTSEYDETEQNSIAQAISYKLSSEEKKGLKSVLQEIANKKETTYQENLTIDKFVKYIDNNPLEIKEHYILIQGCTFYIQLMPGFNTVQC